MGSAALQDAIKGITDWGVTVGQVTGKLPKATDVFGSLTFNDEVQKARLPKPRLPGAAPHDHAGEPLDPSVADIDRVGAEGLGASSTARRTTRTGSSRSPASRPRSTTPSSRRPPTARPSRSSAARN